MLMPAPPIQSVPESYISFSCSHAPGENDRCFCYPLSTRVLLEVRASRRLGVCVVSAEIVNDRTGNQTLVPLPFEDTVSGTDVYRAKIDLQALCENEPGLLFCTVRLHRGDQTLYLSPTNNVDFVLTSEKPALPFRMNVYADDFHTPAWAKSAVMYHIFVDRFAKSEKHTLPVRDNARLNPDWDAGTPEYAPYPGAPLANNEFFGGSLYGILEKLDYLQDLGVELLYLSPIFKAYSNHKYDTGDYSEIDEMFGGREAFEALLAETDRRGMHVILDGVFNHTGDDSLYFNRYGRYDSVGAYQSPASPYHAWYTFRHFPDAYEAWWGIPILPKLNNNNPPTRDFFLGEKGILRRYIANGTSGWRLDVADELPSDFLTELRTSVKSENPEALILGEVWENAADKVAYGQRRKYLSGYQLDSVMNYPFKNAILDYIRSKNAACLYDTVTELLSMYPPESASVLMNLLGTHDTERILTALGATDADYALSNDGKAAFRLSEDKRAHAIQLLKLASVLEFTLPGLPSIFYGDEAGMEGFGDPFCRRPYPWGREDGTLREHYRVLAHLKREEKALHASHLSFLVHEGARLGYVRTSDVKTDRRVVVFCNMQKESARFEAPIFKECAFTRACGMGEIDEKGVCVPGESAVILLEKK